MSGVFLPAGTQMTLTASAVKEGNYVIVGTPSSYTVISAGTSSTIGPFAEGQQYEVNGLTYSQSARIFSGEDREDTLTVDDMIDEDTMTSDSATKVPTQQSVKAYVDANSGIGEEDDWTPTIGGTGTYGAGTYSTQTGYHRRVGSAVTVQACIAWSTHTGSGNAAVTLPFPGRTGLTQRIPVNWSGQGLGAVQQVYLQITAGSTTATMYYVNNSGTPTAQTLATSGTNFVSIQGMYFADDEA
jgi:hypothetical protein